MVYSCSEERVSGYKGLYVITLIILFTVSILGCGGVEVSNTGDTGSVQLAWNRPTTNTDGSDLTDLAGFKVYYGREPYNFTQVINISDSEVTEISIGNLAAVRWYFSVTALNSFGYESNHSSIIDTLVLVEGI